MTIDEALRKLREKYESGEAQPVIYDPVAWALYQVWKEADSEAGMRLKIQREIREEQEKREKPAGQEKPKSRKRAGRK